MKSRTVEEGELGWTKSFLLLFAVCFALRDHAVARSIGIRDISGFPFSAGWSFAFGLWSTPGNPVQAWQEG